MPHLHTSLTLCFAIWWSLLLIVILCSSMYWPVLPMDTIHVGCGFCVGVSLHCSSLVFGQDSFPSTISTFISWGVGVCWKLYRSRLQVQSRPLDVARSIHNLVSQIDLTILNPWLRLGLSGGSTLQAPSNVTVSTISSA